MEFNLESLVRENIRQLKPYSSARHEFTGNAMVYLDANENAFGSPLPQQYNRYPDTDQSALKEKIGNIKGIDATGIFIGNGSDEAIDLLIRIFCEPGKDNILLLPPTYGMYEVCAGVNNVAIKKVLLTSDFNIDTNQVLAAVDGNTKMIFICSPNNPTGNCMRREDIQCVLQHFDGIVVVDEAYIDFATAESFAKDLSHYPNLVILQTLSKAWGLAALRIGMAYASTAVIALLNKIKFPYNISLANQQLALAALDHIDQMRRQADLIKQEKQKLASELTRLSLIKKIYPSDANFILIQVADPLQVYNYLSSKGIIVRDRSSQPQCEGCLRITIGTPEENTLLLQSLINYTR